MENVSLAPALEGHQLFCLDRRLTRIENQARQPVLPRPRQTERLMGATTYKRLSPVIWASNPLSPHCARLTGAFAMEHRLNRALIWFWQQHFPPLCLLCEQALVPTSPDHLCQYCRLALPLNIRACSCCALPLLPRTYITGDTSLSQEPAPLCGNCLTKPLADHAVVPLIHRGSAAHLIHRLKFHQGEPEGRALAHILLTHIRLEYPNRLPDLLIPVPMGYWPAVKRGFNQGRLLAQYLGRELDLPVAHTFLERRPGPAQRSLSRAERRRMASGNFRWRRGAAKNALGGKHVVVVDDVITTGATARQVIKLLRLHGAERVDVWCATRTPLLHP